MRPDLTGDGTGGKNEEKKTGKGKREGKGRERESPDSVALQWFPMATGMDWGFGSGRGGHSSAHACSTTTVRYC